MKEIILIKLGEIVLKGLNRQSFEFALIRNLRRRLEPLGKFDIREAQSTIYVEPLEDGIDLEAAAERVGKVFGVIAFSRACMAEKNMDSILKTAADYLRDQLSTISSFKVESKRSDKHFPLKSPEISAAVGEYLLQQFPNLHVDVHQPRPGGAGGGPRLRRVYPWEGAARRGRHPGGDGRQGGDPHQRRHRQPCGCLADGPARPGIDGCPLRQPALHQ